jgi:pimeloyl-ACP methyl ester carboxylesterase
MPKAFVNGINIHYVQTGRGPDLVLIHGLASNLGQWQLSILPALVEDFRVTMYDLRGHGYSDMPTRGYTPDHMVSDFSGLMDYLDLKRACILGHSYGGLVALHYAAVRPEHVNKLIIADTAVPSLEPRGGARWPSGWLERSLGTKRPRGARREGGGRRVFDGANVEAPRSPLAWNGATPRHSETLVPGKHYFYWQRVLRESTADTGDDSPDTNPSLAHLRRSFTEYGEFPSPA